MAEKKTKPQPEKVGECMKKFKEGELKSGSGKPVTNRKQAIAIAMHEAGISKEQTAKKEKGKENKKKKGE
jgi:hypothetical protein